MGVEQELWLLEEALWTGGAEVYQRILAEDCIMVFPSPAAIMRHDQIVSSIQRAARWRSVTMDERVVMQPSPETALLVYVASALRADGPMYRVLCSSAYSRRKGAWQMVLHQQTPMAEQASADS